MVDPSEHGDRVLTLRANVAMKIFTVPPSANSSAQAVQRQEGKTSETEAGQKAQQNSELLAPTDR